MSIGVERLLLLGALFPIVGMGQGSDFFPGPGQAAIGDDARPLTFESVSIEIGGATADRSIRMSQATGEFEARNVTLKDLIEFAYKIDDSKISGGPDWVYTDGYNVTAQAPIVDADIDPNRAERVMLRGMLWDLFEVDLDPIIEWHFSLTVDRSAGPKFQELQRGANGEPQIRYEERVGDSSEAPYRKQGQIIGRRATMSALSKFMEDFVGGPVVDRTALTGEYDFALSWTRGSDDPVNRKDRLRDEMGLILRRVPVQHFVIDSARRPLTD